MTIPELIRAYEEIIKSLQPLTDHPLEAGRSAARIQIDRCKRSIRELKANLLDV